MPQAAWRAVDGKRPVEDSEHGVGMRVTADHQRPSSAMAHEPIVLVMGHKRARRVRMDRKNRYQKSLPIRKGSFDDPRVRRTRRKVGIEMVVSLGRDMAQGAQSIGDHRMVRLEHTARTRSGETEGSGSSAVINVPAASHRKVRTRRDVKGAYPDVDRSPVSPTPSAVIQEDMYGSDKCV